MGKGAGAQAPSAPFSQGPVRKKQRSRGFERSVTSEPTSAQCPRARESIRPSSSLAAASDMISFGGSDGEMDDSLMLAASDVEELSGSVTDPTLFSLSSSCNARLRMDEELIRVMSKAVNELGLEWFPPEEPSRRRLDEWILPGCHQAPRQRSSPFFPMKSMMSSLNGGVPPTRLASVLLLPLLSPPLTGLKRRNKCACPL